MKIDYSLTLADYQAAQFLHWRQTPGRRFTHFLVYEGIPIVAAATGCVIAKRVGLFGSAMPYWFEASLGMGIAIIYLKLTAKRRNAKLYRKQYERRFPAGKRAGWIEATESGISSAVFGTEAESFQWDSFVGLAQDEKMTLFYVAENRFLLFPTPAKGSPQRAELDALVARHIAGRT